VWHARPGDQVTEGEPLFTLLTDEPERFDRALASLEGGYSVSSGESGDDAAGFTRGEIVLDRVS
ncbi:MAG TPA: thymidine phosphorylase, partial [Nocardioides sp.]|nr:thymidine phosphorylase [Nocardioides sp.]